MKLVAFALVASTFAAVPAAAQQPLIRPGETLTYRVSSARFGSMGAAVMHVDTETVDGRPVYRISFDYSARITLFRISDQTRSWLDAATLSTLRYTKRERSPLSDRDEHVQVLPGGMWSSGATAQALGSSEPLDELAFIYLVRTLADSAVSVLEMNRHFDAARNPVRMQMLGRQTIQTPTGPASALVVQMEVRDSRQKDGVGRIRFYVSDDDARIPLRIDTSMPVAGNMTLTLESVSPGRVAAR